MIEITINGRKHNLPTSWDDVTFGQFLALSQAKDNLIEIFPILLGVTVEDTKTTKIKGLEKILPLLQFLKQQPAIDEKPTKLGDYILPADIGFETIEQFEDTKAELVRVIPLGIQEKTEAMAFYAAVYCQGTKEPYDSDKAKALAKEFLNYPCLEVLAAGSFFQAKCQNITSGLSMTYLRKNILLRKNRPGLKRFLTRLGFMLHLIPLRDTLAKPIKTS